MKPIFNFSAGPAMLPKEVMQQAQAEFCNWQDHGTSVMEISHRSKDFLQLVQKIEKDLRDLLHIPAEYRIIFCHGGARGQFSAVPLNLLGENKTADYVQSGYWSKAAYQEAIKYCNPACITVEAQEQGLRAIKPMREWALNNTAAYVHYCPNETIEGIAIHEEPEWQDKVIVADLSSAILSKPIDVSRYGVIYAGAQKNIGPAGLTIVLIREDLLGKARPETPSIFDYQRQVTQDSMLNTPPTFAWYLAGLVFQWLLAQGGLKAIEQRNREKAAHLYHFIDSHDFYANDVAVRNRSWMNVIFTLAEKKLEAPFLSAAEEAGLYALKGHRIVGGMRASIYNAMPLEGVFALTEFMADFAKRYG